MTETQHYCYRPARPVVRLRLVTLMATGVWTAAAIAALDQGLSQAYFITKAALIVVAVCNVLLPLFRNV